MNHTVITDRTTRRIDIRVEPEGTECDFDATESYHARPRTVRPNRALIVDTKDGGVTVTLRGPILRKDGTTGGVSGDWTWDSSHRRRGLDTAPQWVRDLVAQVLA